MKKFFLGMFVCVTILFSSCLGDNESTYTGSDDFAVIKKSEGVLYATSAVTGFTFTWDGIDKFTNGDAVYLSSYHLNYDNASGKIVKADYVNVLTTFPVASQLSVNTGVADTISNLTNKLALKNLIVIAHQSVASWLDDKWEISYAYDKKEGEIYSLEFVYDATKQKLKGKDLPPKTAIVDVFIKKTGEGIGEQTEVKTQQIVVNFNKLRTAITPSDLTSATTMNIQFRISSKVTTGSTTTYDNKSALMGTLYYPAK